MPFTAPNSVTNNPSDDHSIENHAFYPALSLQAFRTAMRVDSVTSSDRATNALELAMIETNQRLTGFLLNQQDQGYTTLNDVPEKAGMPTGTNEKLYLRAVYSLAKADLVEKYRDYDITAKGAKRADELDPSIDEHRRNAAWAINDLMQRPRSTIELI